MSFPVDDQYWIATENFTKENVKVSDTVLCPDLFQERLSAITRRYDAIKPHEKIIFTWAIVHKGMVERIDHSVLREVTKSLAPVFANEVFVVFSGNPTLPRISPYSPHLRSLTRLLHYHFGIISSFTRWFHSRWHGSKSPNSEARSLEHDDYLTNRAKSFEVVLPKIGTLEENEDMERLISFQDLPNRIMEERGGIVHSQKLGDSADFSDPRIDLILRHGLRVTPQLHPRQWEFAMTYLQLLIANALTPTSRGISFGSGREPLIFPIAAITSNLTVTDLYSDTTSWGVAKTGKPREFVLEVAPQGFNPSNLDVSAMDMREISFPDGAFDFAYSISAMEHIGDDPDFLQHLREVRRVLRPSGVYVMTTELCFRSESYRSAGNYSFALNHLLSLFAAAGLRAEPVFDARLNRRAENAPRDLSETRWHDVSHDLDETLIVREFAGVMSAPGIFILRPANPAPVRVIGLGDTIAWLQSALEHRVSVRYSDWVSVNPFALFANSKSPFCSLWGSTAGRAEEGGVVFGSAYLGLGTQPIDVQITLVASADMASSASLVFGVNSIPPPESGAIEEEHHESITIDPLGRASTVRIFRIHPRRDRSYCIFGRHLTGKLSLAHVAICLRRTPP
jgi:SAM-dependent methyltransferase